MVNSASIKPLLSTSHVTVSYAKNCKRCAQVFQTVFTSAEYCARCSAERDVEALVAASRRFKEDSDSYQKLMWEES